MFAASAAALTDQPSSIRSHRRRRPSGVRGALACISPPGGCVAVRQLHTHPGGTSLGGYQQRPRAQQLARGPGMFALSEPDEIRAVLGAAGFDQVECDSYAPTIVLGGGGGLDDSVDFLF